jgi:hypothetical protein
MLSRSIRNGEIWNITLAVMADDGNTKGRQRAAWLALMKDFQ